MSSSVDKRFVRLLGRMDFVRRETGLKSLPDRADFEWGALPASPERPELYEEVHLADDHEQPAPLGLQVLFRPTPAGIYDVQWLAKAGGGLDAGAPVVRGYRVPDGLPFTQRAAFPLRVTELCVKRNDRAVAGDPILRCEIPSVSLDLTPVRALVEEMQMQLAQAVNTGFKGLLAAEGQGGHIAKSVMPVAVELQPERGEEALLDQAARALAEHDLHDGDVVVVSESLFAIAQGRLFPLEILYELDPKTTDDDGREDALMKIREHVPDVDVDDLLCADALPHLSPPQATAGMRDPNRVAHKLAKLLHEKLGRRVDVVITDTDTGLEVRRTLIGCITIASTPLGATGGLVLYECMRVASAAEFCRGSSRGIPMVVCRPHERRATREGVGEARGYAGRLDLSRERLVGYA